MLSCVLCSCCYCTAMLTEELACFGEWFVETKLPLEEIKFELLRHGRCLVEEAMLAAMRARLVNSTWPVWSSGAGLSPYAVMELVRALNLDTRDRQLRVELHNYTSSSLFLAHAHTHST